MRDDASIGNASDNLEAPMSEAPSNHSGSSFDLEENDQNDNLSDMVSANVSGRGSPNISGRDTPSSQVTENSNNPIPAPQMVQMLNKNRSDIEDKFCKFEIKKLMEGDETISIISDTWSTDVLASDSEAVESNDRNFATPLIPTNVILPGDHNYDPMISTQFRRDGNMLDTSETQSESAWSTDVLASDSEKLAEVDNDDNLSIAAKSDADSINRDNDLNGAIGFNLRTPDSPFFSYKNAAKMNNRTPTSARTPESPFSNRSYDESPKGFEGIKFPNNAKRNSNNNNNNNGGGNTSNVEGAVGPLLNFLGNIDVVDATKSNNNNNLQEIIRQSSSDAEQMENLIDVGDFNDRNVPDVEKFRRNLDDTMKDINIIKSDPNIMNPFFEETNEIVIRENGMEQVVETRYSADEHKIANNDYRRNGVIVLNQSHASDDLIKLDDNNFPESSDSNSKQKQQQQQPNSVKQSRSTGAIPKSISFDLSAEKGQSRRGGLLNKIKGFANMKGRRNRMSQQSEASDNSFPSPIVSSTPQQHEVVASSAAAASEVEDTTEDILGKYRRKISTSSDPATSDSTGSNSSSSLKSKSSQSDIIMKK